MAEIQQLSFWWNHITLVGRHCIWHYSQFKVGIFSLLVPQLLLNPYFSHYSNPLKWPSLWLGKDVFQMNHLFFKLVDPFVIRSGGCRGWCVSPPMLLNGCGGSCGRHRRGWGWGRSRPRVRPRLPGGRRPGRRVDRPRTSSTHVKVTPATTAHATEHSMWWSWLGHPLKMGVPD